VTGKNNNSLIFKNVGLKTNVKITIQIGLKPVKRNINLHYADSKTKAK